MSDDTQTSTVTDDTARDESTDDDAQGAADGGDTGDTGLVLTLGRCHYGDFDEPAVAVAAKTDGTGWVAVCEEHKDQAVEEGYEIRSEVDDEGRERPVDADS